MEGESRRLRSPEREQAASSESPPVSLCTRTKTGPRHHVTLEARTLSSRWDSKCLKRARRLVRQTEGEVVADCIFFDPIPYVDSDHWDRKRSEVHSYAAPGPLA